MGNMPKHYWFDSSGYDIKIAMSFPSLQYMTFTPTCMAHISTNVRFLREFVFLPLSNEDPNCQTHNLFTVTIVTRSTCITDPHALERFIDHESVNHYQISMNWVLWPYLIFIAHIALMINRLL